MDNKNTIVINLRKTKLKVWLTLSLLFIGLGIWLTLQDSTFYKIIGFLLIISFAINIIDLIIKKINSKRGLIIDENGITDNSPSMISKQILWNDIIEIKTTKAINRILIIMVKNPEYYINSNEINSFMRNSFKSYLKEFGSPFIISENTFHCDFNELKNILEMKLAEFKIQYS